MTVVNVLSIAGTDPTGGAGIQADLKSIAANGGYGMAAVTALVAQNTRGVREVHVPPTAFLTAQLDAVSDDVRIDAVKIGMLASAEVIEAVGEWLRRVRPPVTVLDPVMIATSGDRLLDADATDALRRLIPLADLITPNLPELAIVAGRDPAGCWEEALGQARLVAAEADVRVLAKGGHLPGDQTPDALVSPSGEVLDFPGARIPTSNTHGTGCSLSAAIATRAARNGADWGGATAEAKAWLRESLAASDRLDVGSGHGPLHHFSGLWTRGGLDTAPAAPGAPAAAPTAPPGPTAPTAEAIREDWWVRIAGVRRETDDLRFIRGLADGTLPREQFLDYVAQDALYLGAYARVLARVSALAPSAEEQAFWAKCAQGAIIGELELHRARLEAGPGAAGTRDAEPSATTTGYINHLLAASTRGYEEAAAATLPCFWMYADLGARLTGGAFGEFARSADHPYAEWLATYDDPVFAEDTETAIGFVTRAAAQATPATRERMRRAFEAAAVWEREFFGQTAADA
ncbi:bifunctional hydroxymethylpyrimidine kinase/phosphomethylpyrimidine kinase [Leucobacter sp. CSA1]|uniref:Bifunctional hydroxymethylpyrimidine kinase/phosphomethylpyrimidine kinase n=1 Tax=Leucobacter chromiisoli TaxID=2796471 RepID=A0A934Q7N0_9MICO|nr:bifunctional hydroxymethylpyrimidine kinase/phosphomethylpyrimidine kinase [Leucobacter chromiisoli]MBK0419775.1 bifunctional hydroxymethylpyrimidine kinase/phosphomethylpyrimidine kinase [Leucobacter chromiisoli]